MSWRHGSSTEEKKVNKREKETETLNEETVVSRESKNERWNSGSICGIGVKVGMEVRVRERERE